MNMFKSVKASTVEEYIDSIPIGRKEDFMLVDKFIQKKSPSLKRHFADNMVGYGAFSYKNHKKQLLDWPVISLANQKNYISIYVCALSDGEYVAEKYKKELGKVSVGKSCIRFKKLSDVNLTGLEKVIKLAEKFPGLK